MVFGVHLSAGGKYDRTCERYGPVSGIGDWDLHPAPSLAGYYPQPKELLISEILSYQGLTGIYLPFTVEANYNGDMPAYDKPFTFANVR